VNESNDRPAKSGTTAPTLLTLAAWASIGAGAIHATAVGLHAEHRQAAFVFTAVAAFQITWAVLALAVPNRVVAWIGALGSLGLVAGYLVTRTSGISFIDGLEVAESGQVPDTIAAILAGAVVVLCLTAATTATPATAARRFGPVTAGVGMALVLGLAVPAVANAAVSTHEHGDAGHEEEAAHDHADPSGEDAGGTETAAVAPVPYDPTQPIDLGGVPGITPEEQAAAENLIAVTLLRLPQFADPADAEAAGFNSIGDGATGYEHYINWDLIDDDRILDPDHPESLVYRREGGEKTLVSAMFMLPTGTSLSEVPELGGALTQWHIHDNLCFSDDPDAATVAGVTSVGGDCAAPLVKFDPVPMIHVWITPHECGPFAALEGVGAGQIADGEERLCDHVHGA
jgi:hypothetical protein